MKSMLIGVVALAAVACSAPVQSPLWPAFEAWEAKFEKRYENEVERLTRFAVWEENAGEVQRQNVRFSLGLETFTMEMNAFADLSSEEFAAQRLTRWIPRESDENVREMVGASPPSTQDWTSQGWVTGVKDQGQCGSCWSFSTTGSLEGMNMNKTGKLVSLSEQQLVSCDKSCYACDGGNVDLAFRYYMKTSPNGAESEASYPYVSGSGNVPSCASEGKSVVATITGYTNVKSGSESALQSAVGLVGPVSVAIDASLLSFQLYSKGIYAPSHCSSTSLDHAVLVTGYNANSDGQYWIIKNSWGTGWGMSGYMWMARNDGNMCGVATDASYPTFW